MDKNLNNFSIYRFEHCTDFDRENAPKFQYQLILRRWLNINPSMEFRCFIRNQKLIAISQRDVRTFYDYIRMDKSEIIEDISNFFEENIEGKFPLDNCNVHLFNQKCSVFTLVNSPYYFSIYSCH